MQKPFQKKNNAFFQSTTSLNTLQEALLPSHQQDKKLKGNHDSNLPTIKVNDLKLSNAHQDQNSSLGQKNKTGNYTGLKKHQNPFFKSNFIKNQSKANPQLESRSIGPEFTTQHSINKIKSNLEDQKKQRSNTPHEKSPANKPSSLFHIEDHDKLNFQISRRQTNKSKKSGRSMNSIQSRRGTFDSKTSQKLHLDAGTLLVAEKLQDTLIKNRNKRYMISPNRKYLQVLITVLKKVNIIISVLSLSMLFFQKPHWCERNRLKMSNDCQQDINGNDFHLVVVQRIPSQYVFQSEIAALLTGILNYSLNSLYKKNYSARIKKVCLLTFLLMVHVTCYLLFYFLGYWKLNDFVFIFTLIFHYRIMRRTINRIFRIFMKVLGIFIFQFLMNIFFGILLFVLNVGEVPNESQVYYYSFNFTTVYKSIISVMFLSTSNNFPDLFLNYHEKSNYNFSILVIVQLLITFYTFFFNFILFAILQGYIFENFKETIKEDLSVIKHEEDILIALQDLNKGLGINNYDKIEKIIKNKVKEQEKKNQMKADANFAISNFLKDGEVLLNLHDNDDDLFQQQNARYSEEYISEFKQEINLRNKKSIVDTEDLRKDSTTSRNKQWSKSFNNQQSQPEQEQKNQSILDSQDNKEKQKELVIEQTLKEIAEFPFEEPEVKQRIKRLDTLYDESHLLNFNPRQKQNKSKQLNQLLNPYIQSGELIDNKPSQRLQQLQFRKETQHSFTSSSQLDDKLQERQTSNRIKLDSQEYNLMLRATVEFNDDIEIDRTHTKSKKCIKTFCSAFMKYSLTICRTLLTTCPVILVELSEEDDIIAIEFLYLSQLVFNSWIFSKLIYVIFWKYRRRYFRSFRTVYDLISVVSLQVVLLVTLLTEIHLRQEKKFSWIYLLYSFLCFNNFLALTYHFRNFKQITKMLMVLKYAFRQSYPVLILIFILHVLFSVIGCALFGGKINNLTPEKFKIHTKEVLPDNYELFHFNELISAVIYLYTFILNNNIIILADMATIKSGSSQRSPLQIFFYVYMFLVRDILITVFSSLMIGIFIQFFMIVQNKDKPQGDEDSSAQFDIQIEDRDNDDERADSHPSQSHHKFDSKEYVIRETLKGNALKINQGQVRISNMKSEYRESFDDKDTNHLQVAVPQEGYDSLLSSKRSSRGQDSRQTDGKQIREYLDKQKRLNEQLQKKQRLKLIQEEVDKFNKENQEAEKHIKVKCKNVFLQN